MTVDTSDSGIHPAQHGLLLVSILLPPRILQIVGVDDTDNVPELIRPARAVVKPGQVLWLLQNSHIRLFFWNILGDIANWNNTSFVDGVSAGVEVYVERRVEIYPPSKPVADVRLLLVRSVEHGVRMN